MKKENTSVAKVNKEIGGWDYKGFHIDRDKAMKCLTIVISGDEVLAKTLGEAKKIIDNVAEEDKPITNEEVIETTANIIAKAFGLDNERIVNFVSKKGTPYLLKITGDKIRAFTYEGGSIEPKGKKMYWSVTQEMRQFVAGLV